MDMKYHELKIHPKFYRAILSGLMTSQFRNDDRNFQEGDILILKEWVPINTDPDGGSYTQHQCVAQITHIARDIPGLPDGYVLMSILNISEAE